MARMQGKTTTDARECHAGIDVSKATLDLALAGTRRVERFANDPAGIAALLDRLSGPHLVVLEPTGRLHLAVWRALHAAGHRVAPVNPHRARLLAEGLGQLAKTDALDARHLARLAAMGPGAAVPRPPPEATGVGIAQLVSLRRAQVRRRTAARNSLKDLDDPFAQGQVRAEIAAASDRIAAVDAEIARRIAADPARARKAEILRSLPGIGATAAAVLIADLPELGQIGPRQIAALAGCAPMDRQSGTARRPARTRGGRRHLREALHMPAIVAMTRNPDLAAFARRLRDRGKPAALVITATLRKLLTLANTLLAQDRIWEPRTA